MGGDLMQFNDKLNNFRRYALTSNTSIYNEDAVTAQGLLMECRKTIAECMKEVNRSSERLKVIEDNLSISYDGDIEELKLSITNAVALIKEQVESSYTSLFNEDAMTNLENSGQMAKAVNECVKAVNLLSDTVDLITDHLKLTYDGNNEEITIGGGGNE